MYRVAIFGSGSGTNAQNILKYFEESEVARVHLVLTNKRSAGIIDRARPYSVPVVVFDRDQMESGTVLERLKATRSTSLYWQDSFGSSPSISFSDLKTRS